MYFTISTDHEVSERCGAGGMFQVISIEDENHKTYEIDCGIHFESLREVIEHIGFNPDDHDYEEV